MEVYWLLSTTREWHVYMNPDERWGVRALQRVQKEKVVPGLGCHHKVCNPNDGSNDVVYLVEYNVEKLPQFQDILEKLARKEILEVVWASGWSW